MPHGGTDYGPGGLPGGRRWRGAHRKRRAHPSHLHRRMTASAMILGGGSSRALTMKAAQAVPSVSSVIVGTARRGGRRRSSILGLPCGSDLNPKNPPTHRQTPAGDEHAPGAGGQRRRPSHDGSSRLTGQRHPARRSARRGGETPQRKHAGVRLSRSGFRPREHGMQKRCATEGVRDVDRRPAGGRFLGCRVRSSLPEHALECRGREHVGRPARGSRWLAGRGAPGPQGRPRACILPQWAPSSGVAHQVAAGGRFVFRPT